jgi:hypothetical protein
VRKAGDRLSRDQAGAVRELDVEQRAHPVAQRGSRLLSLVEGRDRAPQILVVTELEHRSLPAADHQHVECGEVEIPQLRGLIEHAGDLGRVERPHRDQVVRRPAALVSRIRQGVERDGASGGARDRHSVLHLRELVERVEELSAPKAHRPAGGR